MDYLWTLNCSSKWNVLITRAQWALVSADASASLGFFLPSMTTMTRHLLTEKKRKEKGGRENDILVSNNPSALDVAAMNETIDGE